MRKWTYLVATLLMAGTTATFTGCIDTDEPEGIAELRGAKSEFIKAQAAVELVEVELKKAKVAEQELLNAGLALQNKSAEIDLQLHELDIQVKKLLIEREEAITAQKKAEVEAAIAKAEADKAMWEGQKDLVIEQYKEKMLIAETATAKAQDAYKQAMEQIEASKILLTDEEQIRLNSVQVQVAYAKKAMDMAMYGYSTVVIEKQTSSKVTDASSSTEYYIYVITTDPSKADGGYTDGSLKKLQEQLLDYPNWVVDGNIEAKLDEALAKAEFNLERAQKAADKLKAILDNDYKTVADWEAESKKLDDEIAALAVQQEQYNIDREKLEVANPKVKSNLDAAKLALTTAKKAQTDNKNKAKTSAPYTVKADKSIIEGLNAAVSSVEGLTGYTAGTFTYEKNIYITEAQKTIDGWNKLIDVATKGINLEELEWSKLEVEKAKAAQKIAEDTYATDLKAWKDALAAYNKVADIDVAASLKAAEKAIDDFNGKSDAERVKVPNITALATALATYYQNALDKDGQVTEAQSSVNGKTTANSTLILADAENLYKVVLDKNVTWDKGSIKAFTVITPEQKNDLLKLKDVVGSSKEAKWTAASAKVFGNQFNVDGKARLLEVTEAEVIAAVKGNELDAALNTTKYGTLGNKIYATATTKSLVAIVEQAATYKALKDAFIAQYAAEQTALDKANTVLADAVTKAKDVCDKAQTAYDKIFKDLDDKSTKATKESEDKESIKGVINQQITKYLNDNFEGYTGATLEDIKAAVQEEYQTKLEAITTEKSNVADAKRNIEKLAEGTYTDNNYIEDTFANIQENIKVKQAEYDAAKADYDTASAQLKALLAIFLK
ncbi:hypothetical protein [Bacteroides sp.]|uniref:hypothetical protein n=1 Tax=Bacteroides sp. TaxID=29523 RepID=UPI002A817BDC|nr:hypothetical protein [Bacteroides sp.]